MDSKFNSVTLATGISKKFETLATGVSKKFETALGWDVEPELLIHAPIDVFKLLARADAVLLVFLLLLFSCCCFCPCVSLSPLLPLALLQRARRL